MTLIDGAQHGMELKDSDAPQPPLAVVVYGATSPLKSQNAGIKIIKTDNYVEKYNSMTAVKWGCKLKW